MALSNGATFAGFRIVRLLGSGGMGEVYLVQHPRLPRHNALKILPAGSSSDTEFRERFGREADLAATLYHPHIVGVHDRGESDGQLWISMDFVDGADAGRLLTDRYPAGMPQELVLAIVSAVAGALDHAHRKGMLHRDVKPANIMLTDDDEGEQRILLADFGIARNVDDVSGLTATNMTVGTVAYAAPEQLMGEELDGRADQYALAATAYHLLTGSRLFPHTNPAVVISHHLSTPPPKVADLRADLGALDEVLSIALAKSPGDRFTRCTDFARAMASRAAPHQAVSHSSPTAAAPASPQLKPEAVPAARKRYVSTSLPVAREATSDQRATQPARPPGAAAQMRWQVPAAVVAVIMLVGMAVLVWRPWQRSPTTPHASSSSTPATRINGSSPGASTGDVAALSNDFIALQSSLTNAVLGIALGAVGTGRAPTTLGDWQSGPAWSTINVPLVMAALRQQSSPTVTDTMSAAITRSDTAASETVWESLGSPDIAAAKVDAVLRDAGDPTLLQSQKIRLEFTAFGQTDWALTDQARFISAAVCDPSAAPVLALMGQVVSNQRWGIGNIPDARLQGGLGPSRSGSYLVRQVGVLTTPNGMTAVALAVEPASGSLEDGTADLNKMAEWLQSHIALLPSGACT